MPIETNFKVARIYLAGVSDRTEETSTYRKTNIDSWHNVRQKQSQAIRCAEGIISGTWGAGASAVTYVVVLLGADQGNERQKYEKQTIQPRTGV